jgi:tetratricopeptide (TPR) repeat protein
MWTGRWRIRGVSLPLRRKRPFADDFPRRPGSLRPPILLFSAEGFVMPGNHQTIFGLEFECPLAAFDERGKRVSQARVVRRFMELAGELFDHVPARESAGIFFANGSHAYIDGDKPEVATPEVTTPTDACRYMLAAEQMLLATSRELLTAMPKVERVILSRMNVSYSGSGNSWACHESYGHRCNLDLSRDFIAHAVSRILYTGSGGFDGLSQGTRFLISPRVAHLRTAVSDNTQRERGIYNTKNEPLNDAGYHRLHVICGEHESSIRSQWLKVATTAVVVAMIEAGMAPGQGLQLCDPVSAMYQFAHDVTLTATALTADGKRITALEMQRQLLQRAKNLDVKGPINDWLPTCLEIWEATLDRLQQGPPAVARMLDWAIKLEMFRHHVQRRGFTWEEVAEWNQVLERRDVLPALRQSAYETMGRNLTTKELASGLRAQAHRLESGTSLDWSKLEPLLRLRQELFEIDMRFSQLDEQGFFNALDRQGLLDHHVAGVEDIDVAMTQPPAAGRAKLRGDAIRNLVQQGKQGACDWGAVWDYHDMRVLDLSNPFAEREQWDSFDQDMSSRAFRLMTGQRAFEQGVSLYDRGNYETAQRLLQLATERTERGDRLASECCRFYAWTQAHRGFIDGASWLQLVHPSRSRTLNAIGDHLLLYRFQGLLPGPELRRWCARGLRRASRETNAASRDLVVLRCAHAFDLLCQGRVVDAWNTYLDATTEQSMSNMHLRFQARILTEKAATLRGLGRFDEAMSLLDQAHNIQADGGYLGDLADCTLLQRAMVWYQLGQVTEAWACLRRAIATQRDLANVMGEARTLLLMARIHGCSEAVSSHFSLENLHERFSQIMESRPALTGCATANKIVQNWYSWVAGEQLGHADPFWGL